MALSSVAVELVDAITKQSWDPRGKSLPLDFGITTTGGKEFTLLERDLTLFYTLSYKSDHSHTTGVYRRFNSNTVYSQCRALVFVLYSRTPSSQ